MTRTPPPYSHFLPAVLFFALALFWTWPLALDLTSQVPGFPGDNLSFLWNSWWMREARASGQSFFRTDLLFAPYGIDLTLHTHTALASWLAASVFAALPVVMAHNLVIVLALALNGYAAYLLALDLTGERGSALLAGAISGGMPYVSAHLLGHVNLLSAWALPLVALLARRAIATGAVGPALGVAAVVTVTAYNDYYYVVYAAALVAALALHASATVTWRRAQPAPTLTRLLVGLLVVDLVLVAVIVLSGGFTTTWRGVRISANEPTNLLAFAWGFGAGLGLLHWRPRLVVVDGRSWRSRLRPLATMATATVVGLSPLWWRGARLMLAGDYVAPAASWRSGPGGVDLLAVGLGHPWHGWLGTTVRTWYARFQLDPVEGVGWLGVAPLLLAAIALTQRPTTMEIRRWRWVAAVFFVWALGPWLRVAGMHTGLLLPQNLMAHLPILGNARIPGRAMVLVGLAVAMLSALVLSRWAPERRRRWLALGWVLVIVDFWPAPFPMTRLETPAIYTVLRDLPPGIVCELPVGIRDGFGIRGVFDDHVLLAQMTHRHPLVGGFAARIPASIEARYRAAPVLRSFWRLSEGESVDVADRDWSAARATAALDEQGVRYLVVNRERASAALVQYVEQGLVVNRVARDGARDLYVIGRVSAP